MFYANKYGYLYGNPVPGTEKFPDIRNPDNKLGAVCKHLDLFLANKRWLTKAASVVNSLIKTYPDKAAKYLYDEETLKNAEKSQDNQTDEVPEENPEVDEVTVDDTDEISDEEISDEEVDETSESDEEGEE
jgi:hypothetical protein